MVFLLLVSVHLFQKVPVKFISLCSSTPTRSCSLDCRYVHLSQRRNVLDEGLLILGGSLDGRGGRLGLATTTGSETNTAEESTENAHGELYRVN